MYLAIINFSLKLKSVNTPLSRVSKQHVACVHAEKVSLQTVPVETETTAIGSSVLEGEEQRYKSFFRTAYAVAKRCKPFEIMNICELQLLISVHLGKNYLHEKAAANFIKYAADEVRLKTAHALIQRRYVPVICDGSTDLTVVEQEIIIVRYFDFPSCQPVMKLAALLDLEHENADGVYSASQKGVKYVISTVSDEFSCALNIVCGNFDGAAVMMGARNGVKAKLTRDHPCATIVHCVAHKLDLAVQDAVRELPYLHEFEATIPLNGDESCNESQIHSLKISNHSPTSSKSDGLLPKSELLKQFCIIFHLWLRTWSTWLLVLATAMKRSPEQEASWIKVASCRFVFWRHAMLDLRSVITNVPRISARQTNDTGNSNCHRRLH